MDGVKAEDFSFWGGHLQRKARVHSLKNFPDIIPCLLLFVFVTDMLLCDFFLAAKWASSLVIPAISLLFLFFNVFPLRRLPFFPTV